MITKKISFHFHPGTKDQGIAIEKADGNGNKRKYLQGVSSGPDVDSHGERMTENAIQSFMKQANSGDILLFPDVHGIKETEDVGILTKAEVLPEGDWWTEYRLYDEIDGIGQNKAEKVETLWKQVNGLPPYTKPKQKGFSIEGAIPEENLIYNQKGELEQSPVIDNVVLDGVVLVPRPAYKDSIATAIYKALGETTPERKQSISNGLRDKVSSMETKDKYRERRWDYQDALEEKIEEIMTRRNNNKQQELELLFDEYKDLMVNLILDSEVAFDKDDEEPQAVYNSAYGQVNKADIKLKLFRALREQLQTFKKGIENEQTSK